VLAEAVGLDAAAMPSPQGALHVPLDPLPEVRELVQAATTRRADLKALREFEAAGRARYELARAEAWPNLTLRAFGGHEEGTDRILGGGFSIPLPLFNRNQGRIEETRAIVERTHSDLQASKLSIGREIVTAHERYRAGVESAKRLRELVLGTLEQNLSLLQRSFEAGKATWPEVIIIRRSAVEAQRELTAAEAEARRAWVELQLAAGRMPAPLEPEDSGE